MMRFKVEGQEFEISFSRHHPSVNTHDANGRAYSKKAKHPSTTAQILVVNPNKKPKDFDVHRSFTVGCYHRDNFTHEDGRLAALKMISKGTSLSREFKAAMWDAYQYRDLSEFKVPEVPETIH